MGAGEVNSMPVTKRHSGSRARGPSLPEANLPEAGDSLWTSALASRVTPFRAGRGLRDIEGALDFDKLSREPEDARVVAFSTPVTSEVMSLPTQDRDGSPWRPASR